MTLLIGICFQDDDSEELLHLQDELNKYEREESSKESVQDTFQLLIEKGLNKQLGKGSKKSRRRERNGDSFLAPPHAETDCFINEKATKVEDSKEEEEEDGKDEKMESWEEKDFCFF